MSQCNQPVRHKRVYNVTVAGKPAQLHATVGSSIDDVLQKAIENVRLDDEHGFQGMGKGAGI